MKVIVSTFNNSKNNYGAMFQSCGLSSFLIKLNYDVSYIVLEQRNKKKENKKNLLKKRIKSIVLLPHLKQIRLRKEKMRQFGRETQKQIVYHTQEELYNNPPQADVYISGSDQVWNPVSFHEDLFLAYAPEGSKKISYAASMGNEKIPEINKKRFAELIGQYSAVSVREDTIADIIRPFTKKEIHQHIDPVFLKSKTEWKELEKPYGGVEFEKFILVYAIEWNVEHDKRLLELKKRTGLPAVSVNIGNIKKVCADQIIYDASPNEFLYLLDRAEYVVATSFHGVAMSIVYNKPFVALAGNNMPTRIESLMRHFDIDIFESENYGSEEFARINEIILKDQAASKAFLEYAIGQ